MNKDNVKRINLVRGKIIKWKYFSAKECLLVFAIDKGATYANLGTIDWIPLPYSFKFLIAPFVDAYYIKWIGKRKTYACLSTLFSGLLMLYYSFKIEENLNNLNI